MLTILINQKYNEAFWSVYILRIRDKTFCQISLRSLSVVVILVLESKAVLCHSVCGVLLLFSLSAFFSDQGTTVKHNQINKLLLLE